MGLMESQTVVLSLARTPFAKLNGALASLDATTLGAAALVGALQRAGIDPSDVEHVAYGEVLQAGVGQNPARQVLFKSGLAKTVTAETLNKVCASGMLAVATAMRLINTGANRVVAAGGMESMSNAPYLLKDARSGYRFGDGTLIDEMIYDGLWDQYFPMTMATQGGIVANELGLTREEQDRFAYESHRRAHATHEAGNFADEIVPIRVATKSQGQDRRRCAAATRERARAGDRRCSEQGVESRALRALHARLCGVGTVRHGRCALYAGRSRRSGARRRKP